MFATRPQWRRRERSGGPSSRQGKRKNNRRERRGTQRKEPILACTEDRDEWGRMASKEAATSRGDRSGQGTCRPGEHAGQG